MPETDLRPYQRAAVNRWREITSAGGRRATLVLPCGTGKTVVARELIADQSTAITVFFVPTIVLLDQTCRGLTADLPHLPILRVCSDTATADDDAVHTETELAELTHVAVTTDADTIAEHLRIHKRTTLVATYASAAAVVEAATKAGVVFDLTVCDEAHRTAGAPDKAWALPVSPDFPSRRHLFMTATTRTIEIPKTPAAATALEQLGWTEDDIVSMDDLAAYGPHISTLTFREAIDTRRLSDYEIAVIGITTRDARTRLAAATGGDYTVTDAAAHLALARAVATHPHLRSVLAFHNRIDSSKAWTERLAAVYTETARTEPIFAHRPIRGFHLDASDTTETRHRTLAALADPGDTLTVVSNCRVLAEGIDVPALDAALFAAPRTSGPDIIQIIGRAIRPHPDGPDHKALIIIPVLIAASDDDTDIDNAAARTSHLAAWRILTSLAEQDELLHRSLLDWRANTNADASTTAGPLTIELPTGISELGRDVFLRTIERTVSPYLRTAAVLRDFAAVYGHVNPRPDKIFRGFPLGRAVRATRAARRSGSGALSPRIVAEFDALGFAWNLRDAPPKRSVDEWIDLIELYVAKTGIHTIHPDSFVTDPISGLPAKIGVWHAKTRRRGFLTDTERGRLNGILTAPARGDSA